MDALAQKLGEFWGAAGIICGLQFVAIITLYADNRAKQKELVEVLKANIPAMNKFESTMSTALSVLSKAGRDR